MPSWSSTSFFNLVVMGSKPIGALFFFFLIIKKRHSWRWPPTARLLKWRLKHALNGVGRGTKTHIQNIFNNQFLDRNQPESILTLLMKRYRSSKADGGHHLSLDSLRQWERERERFCSFKRM